MLNRSTETKFTTLGELLFNSAQRHGARKALVFPGTSHSFSELLQGASHIARGLIGTGIKPGEHVGLLASNTVEFMQAFFGIALMGAVVVPLNVRYRSEELAYVIGNASLKAILTQSDPTAHVDFADLLCDALPSLRDCSGGQGNSELKLFEYPKLSRIVLLSGNSRPGFVDREAFDAASSWTDPDEVLEAGNTVECDDTAIIIYTSGTTASPKGVMLSHKSLTQGPLERARERLAVGDCDVHWGAGPLFHIGSLAPALGALGAGYTYATDLYYDAQRALNLIREEHATTIWPWFPAIVLGLLEQPGFSGARLPEIRRIVLIANSALVERVQALFPDAEILQGCGMTETSGIFGLSGPEDSAVERATTQGKVYPGMEVRLVHPQTGEDVTEGDIGEILVRGYCVMKGYYNDPEKTAATLDEQGWLHTGDLYIRTQTGNLVFNGRLKDMLKVGGENVAAVEVESFLSRHPAVRVVEVVGKPDFRLEEVPVAFVELYEGAVLSSQELMDFCKGQIANYKIPREVHFIHPGEWPMSLTKIDKRVLRKRIQELSAVGD